MGVVEPKSHSVPELPDTTGPIREFTLPEAGLVPAEDEALLDTAAWRYGNEAEPCKHHRAANSLAAARRTTRILWISLIASLLGNLILPAYVMTAMTRPEKVALMDGTESLIIAPLVSVEEGNEILETLALWAAKSFLDRGPQGFDMPETLERVYLPEAAKKARLEFEAAAAEFSKKSIHQKLEVGRIEIQRLGDGVVMARVVGQILAQAKIGDEQVSEPQSVSLNLKLVRNPYLGRNKRYPFAVSDYNFGQPEQLATQKRDEK